MKCNGQCVTNHMTRRNFLRFAFGGAASLSVGPGFQLWAQDTMARTRAKSCILLWMGGGPSHLDTFDPKEGHANGGPVKAVETGIRGFRIADNLPKLAGQAKHFSIIRSMLTNQTAHDRASFLLHTGYEPSGGLGIAPLGTILSHELARKDFPLPTFVSLGSQSIPLSPAFGEKHLPFQIRDLRNPIPNLRSGVDADREKIRSKLLMEQDGDFEKRYPGREMEKRHESALRASDLMTTPLMKAMQVHEEPESVRKKYGRSFGQSCLLARRLVEVGVPFVEIGFNGWDTHSNNFKTVARYCKELDSGFSSLLEDLARKDLLRDTLVIWMGEFGRTPTINGSNGRDHWSRGYSVVLAGGGLAGGRIIGDTGPGGMTLKNPQRMGNLFATIYQSLGIDSRKKYNVEGRRFDYAPSKGKPIKGLF